MTGDYQSACTQPPRKSLLCSEVYIGLLITDHVGSQGPVLASEVQEGERHSEEAQKEIRDGKIHYEDVSCCQQNLQDSGLSKVYNDGNGCLCPSTRKLKTYSSVL